MAAIKLPDGQKYGGVGYPMVMTTLAGVELLGILTATKPFHPKEGDERFREFWHGSMYPGQPARAAIADLVYQFVRNGLAHAFVTKPMIVVTKGHHGAHLCRMQDDSICVDALDLADELRAAYDGRVKPRMQQAEFREQVETRFQEFRDSFRGIHRARQDWFAKVLQRYAVTAGDALAPNSPSVNAAYSTNVSGAPRVDDDSGG